LANIKPSVKDNNEAVKNQASDLKNMRPTADASPMCAIPTTKVEKTRGAMIILIKVKKISDSIEK
jgi:hypothetical protein